MNALRTIPDLYRGGQLRNMVRVASIQDREVEQNLKTLKRLIWLYFWLLICEGALRKWVFPSLSAPLLVVRDPVVLLIYLQALRCRRFPANGAVVACFALTASFMLLAIVQIMLGVGGGVLVAAYGLRTNFLHFPLIFVIPKAFSRQDVIKLGKWVLMISIPMGALMYKQYTSSPTSWINAGAQENAQQITFADGRIRPPGTFSFTTGAAHFFVLATVFLLYGLLEKKSPYPRWLLVAALFSVVLVQPVSGSRTLVLSCALIVMAALLFAPFDRARATRIVQIAVVIAIAVVLLCFSSAFREAVSVFMMRWDSANKAGVHESIVGRVFSGFIEPFTTLSQAGLIGRGLGMGTNGGAALQSGALVFLLAETEWARVVLEVGPVLGFSYLLYRVWLAGAIGLRAVLAVNQRQLLPWLLAWHACRSVVMEQLSQPTSLGFVVLVCGLCVAAIAQPGHSLTTTDRRVPWSPPPRFVAASL